MRLGTPATGGFVAGGKSELTRRRAGVLGLMHGEALEDFAPAQEKAGLGIGEDHFAGAEALAFGDARFFEIDEASFGAGDQKAVVRERVAQRAEAVAVELCADELAVGKNQGGGTVPGLAFLRKRSQSGADVPGKKRIVLERRRNHGEHGFVRIEAFEEPKLEGVIEAGGVADFIFQGREPGADGQARAEFALFGAKPAAIRDDGVDFAVVGGVAKGLRKMPGRLRVGGIALVEDGEGRGKGSVAQIFVELRKLPRSEQAFVDDRVRGQRTDVTTLWEERFGALAKKRKAPLEAGDAARCVKRGDEELPNLRHRFESAAAERVRVGGHAAPAEDAKALRVGGGFDGGPGFSGCTGWKKCETQAKDFWEVDALLLRAGTEKILRERGEEACAIAAGAVGIDAAAVSQALEGGKSNVDNFMAGGAAEAGDKACAAGIVIGVAPVGVPNASGWRAPSVHTHLLGCEGEDVQRRFCIYQIGFVGEEILSLGLLKPCDFRKVKIDDLHRGDHHFEGFFAGGPDGGAEELNVAEHLEDGLIESEIADGGRDLALFNQKKAIAGHTGHDFFVGVDFADVPEAGDEQAAIGGGDHFFEGGIAAGKD